MDVFQFEADITFEVMRALDVPSVLQLGRACRATRRVASHFLRLHIKRLISLYVRDDGELYHGKPRSP
jgi:hypothetical protein